MSDQSSYKFFAAELGAQIPELDLHGEFGDAASEKIEYFLSNQVYAGEKVVKIIYGGGTGRLREITLNKLKKHPLVKEYKEIAGSCLVLFS